MSPRAKLVPLLFSEIKYISAQNVEIKNYLSCIKADIQDLSLLSAYKMSLNMKSLLTLHVESQHAVKHFTSKRDTFTLHEYAILFGLVIEKAVKWVSK